MFQFAAGQVTRRLAISVKWRANSTALNFLYARGVKPQNATSNFCRNDSIPLALLPKNGSANFQIPTRTFHFKSPVRNARLDSLCLKNSFILCRNFHLSEPRRAAPLLPVIGAFLARFSGPIAQLLKLMAVVVGR